MIAMSDAVTEGNPPLRSIEKSRTSTCKFADKMANLAIEKMKELSEHDPSTPGVLAAVILEVESNFKVISLGFGTKHTRKSEPSTIHDMHAECLARRGMNHYLAEQFIQSQGDTDFAKTWKFHFYVSSAPCGNACIRRWASVPQEKWIVECGDDNSFPSSLLKHGKITPHAVKEGQFSLLIKKDHRVTIPQQQQQQSMQDKNTLPAGVAEYHTDPEQGILSCSDKICFWNTLGWTKICLRRWLPRIDIASITVGRKFARPHLTRAVCCRMQHSRELSTLVNHPVILCSAVKLHEGGRAIDEELVFNNTPWIWSDSREVTYLDGQNNPYTTSEIERVLAGMEFKQDVDDPRNLKILARKYLEQFSSN
jgi:Adenosine-deaminase (editase) domain